jgi:tetratricopeptide (TPR) repeat protein
MANLPAVLVDAIYARAVEAHRHGRLSEAEEACRTLTATVPPHAKSLYMLGLIRFHEGDTAAAAALIAQALAVTPDDEHFHFSLGMIQEVQGAHAASLAAYRRAVVVQPAFAMALYFLGLAFSRQYWPEQAMRCFRRVLVVEPGHLAAGINLASAMLYFDDLAQGEAMARSVLARDAGQVNAWVVLGKALFRQGRFPAALDAFDRALERAPDTITVRIERCATLLALGRREASGEGLRATAAVVTDAATLFQIGRLLFEAGYDDDAMAVYRRFVGITEARDRFPGQGIRAVAVRPAADVCREHGWPYRVVATAGAFPVIGGDDVAYENTLPEAFLACAEDAVIVPRLWAPLIDGDTILVDGFSTNSRGSLPSLAPIVWHSAGDHMLLDMPEPQVLIEGEAILLGGGPNWTHGVLDWLSKLAVLDGFPELAHLPVLVAATMAPSILELARMVGLAPERMRMLAPDEVVHVRRLWLPSLTHEFTHVSPLHVRFLRDRLAGRIAAGRTGPRRRIFMSRRKAGYRALANEAEVLAALAPFSMELVVGEDMTMDEQIRLFASAELIVAPGGGGSAAIVFAQDDAAFLELYHDRAWLPTYAILTGIIGQRYGQVRGAVCGNRGPLEFDYDFTVDPNRVVAAVREFLRPRQPRPRPALAPHPNSTTDGDRHY